jgi:NADH:ubiquinone oxidoreductase subunit E
VALLRHLAYEWRMAGVPTRSPTHRDIDFARLASLGNEVEEVAEEGPLTPDRVIDLARDRGRPPSHYFAAAVLAAEVELPASKPVQVVVCAGKCQSWGALDLLDRAAELWERQPGFDIVPRQCLDRCEHAAVCEVRGPGGAAVLTRATPDQLEAALAEVTQK